MNDGVNGRYLGRTAILGGNWAYLVLTSDRWQPANEEKIELEVDGAN